jgi:hypothetical protein
MMNTRCGRKSSTLAEARRAMFADLRGLAATKASKIGNPRWRARTATLRSGAFRRDLP